MNKLFLRRVTAFVAALAIPFSVAQVAHAAPVENAAIQDVTTLYQVSEAEPVGQATYIGDGLAEVRTSEGVTTAELDRENDTVLITQPNGQQLRVATPREAVSADMRSATTCTMILWAVDLIRGAGWSAAIAAVAATGPTGAVVLAIMYALGTSAFLAWASTKCQ